MDTSLLRASFGQVADAAAFVRDFYSHLFLYGGEEVLAMFPPLMTGQRDRLAAALVRIVGQVDDLDALVPYLQGLGRDHRKFGAVTRAHYDLVGASLLWALGRHLGPRWTPEVRGTWEQAYGIISATMLAAAEADTGPARWEAKIISREMRGTGTAILRLRLDQPMNYEPGQSMAVQYPAAMPGVWRFYSPADPPGVLPEMTFHVKAADGGLLSPVLAWQPQPGDRLLLGPPVGTLVQVRASPRNMTLIAGATGLAPLMAILQDVAASPVPPDVHLFHGADTPGDLYLLAELGKLEAQHDWLTVTVTVMAGPRDTPGYHGQHGSVVDVAARQDCRGRDVYICGGTPMVSAAVGRLLAQGVPAAQIRTEDFGR